jgi:hypothetical protein
MAETARAIADSAKAEAERLQGIESDIGRKISKLDDIERRRALGDEEHDELIDLRLADSAVLAAIEKLAVVTMRKLNNSDEIKGINNSISGVAANLQKTVDRITKIGRIADRIGTAIAGVEKLSERIAKLLDERKPA